jgi:DNA polymerase I
MGHKTFFLIDGSSYFYRAFYAVGRLTNARGMATHAIYGFARMIFKVLREKQPDYVCVVFDAPGPTFRHEIYPDYKATRQKMPEDLVVQIPYIKDLVRYHGVTQIEMEGYEADDLIASLAEWGRKQGLEVVIASADKDLHQLIEDPEIRQWDPQKDRVITAREVMQRFGIPPTRIIDLLALMGDSSDHIPGVPGVGEKTAQKLLQEWDSLDNLFGHLDQIPQQALRTKLSQNRDLAYLSRRLVVLNKALPIPMNLDDFTTKPPEVQSLQKLYQELNFKGLLEALREQGGAGELESHAAVSESTREVWAIATPTELNGMLADLKAQDQFALALLTSSSDPMQGELAGMAFSWQSHQACVLPLRPTDPTRPDQLSPDAALAMLRPVLSQPTPAKVGHNMKHVWVGLKTHGVELCGIAFDTMVASYLLDPTRSSHQLARIADEHLGQTPPHPTAASDKGGEQLGSSRGHVKEAAQTAGADAETIWRLLPVLRRKLSEAELAGLYETLELPLIKVLARMEFRGVLVDREKLENLSLNLEKAMEQEAAHIYQLAGETFNIQSPKQLGSILFEKLGLTIVKKTKTGPSTDMDVLEVLAGEHPIAEQVLSYRSLAKLKGTYVDALPRLIHPRTGRIHTSYNQTVTATGRLSSSDPNLQNIPIRTDEGKRIRAAFIPQAGHVLLAADYSQIELRILAHLSQDSHLVAAFLEGEDIHRRTAAEMLGIAPHEVTPEMRRQAKTINFGIIYGMGPFGLARELRISNASARAAIERYFDHYAGVKEFITRVIDETRERGYSQTLLGRRRPIPELRSRNRTVRQQGERLAVNTTIQGTAADLIKKAMIEIDHTLTVEGLRTGMILQVHDELIFEAPFEELEQVKMLVREKMENAYFLSVPLRVDLGWGADWATAHA